MSDTDVSTPLPSAPGAGALAPQSPMAPPSLGGNQAEAAERKDMAGPMGKLAGLQGQKPQTPNLQENNQPPPDAKDYQKHSMEFAGAMAVLGAIAGRFTRAPGGAALGAFASALKGWKEGNQQAYENASKEWEEKTKQTIQNNKTVMDKYKLALEDHTKNIDEQMSAIQVIATQYHDQQMYDAAGSKNFTMVAKLYDKNQAQSGRLENSFEWLSGKLKTEREQKAVLAEKVISGEITPRSETERLSFKHIVEQYQAGEYGDVGGPKTPKVSGGLTGQLLAKENSERAARGEEPMTAQEEVSFMQKIHPPRSAPAMAVEAFKKDFQEKNGRPPTGEEIQRFAAEGVGMSREEGAVGQRAGGISLAVQEADDTIPRVLKAGEKSAGKGYATWNAVENKWKVEKGDENFAYYVQQMNSLIGIYGRVINGGNATVSDKEHARDTLNPNMPFSAVKGSLRGFVDEIKTAEDAPGKVRAKMRGKDLGAPGGAAPADATPPAAEIPAGWGVKEH